MKIRIHFKDPDGVADALADAVEKTRPEGLSETEWDDISLERREAINLNPFVEYNEYLTVEIDTDAKTAVVIPRIE